MKTFSEAVEIFVSKGMATDVEMAQRMAQAQSQYVDKKYGHLYQEITHNPLVHHILMSQIQAFTQDMRNGAPPSQVLMNLAYSTFRHGLIVGIEMERQELEDDEKDAAYNELKQRAQEAQDREQQRAEQEKATMARDLFGRARQAAQPTQRRPENVKPLDMPCSPRQIKKLLTMLSMADLIESWFENQERQWDTAEAVEWVRSEVGIKVESLEELTHRQIGKCFEELGE